MERLNYQTLKNLGSRDFVLENAPERVLQFGEGNFLRGFVDYFFDKANESGKWQGKVVVVQPIAKGLTQTINEQQGLYTLYLRGSENGEKINRRRVISSVSRCIDPYEDFAAVLACAENPDLRYVVSNTTEAGIAFDPMCGFDDDPPSSFPAKLTVFLYERYLAFAADESKGLVILSCELIDNNGRELEKCVRRYAEYWELEAPFMQWVEKACLFCSTLVDRIVTGYPKNEAEELNRENGYEDRLLDTAEVFGLWVIEGPAWLEKELPFCGIGEPILVTPDHSPYKMRKVRILNGAHTSMVLGAYLAGQNIVRECMEDDVIRTFMNTAIFDEIIPTLTLPKEELEAFAASVQDRFKNPFIDHALLSIALNSTSKWKARVLPSVKGYVEKFGEIPPCLTKSLAFLIAFYSGGTYRDGVMTCRRGEETYTVQDDAFVLKFYAEHAADTPQALVHAVLSNDAMWGEDLTQIPGFEDGVLQALRMVQKDGAYAAMKV